MPTHEIFTNRNGTVSLRELASGEVMHSSVGPREEATLLYIEQSRLSERLALEGQPELLLYDVGLGAATNALAALQCRRGLPARARRLKIISFESDPSGLALALEHYEQFPFFDGFTDAACAIIRDGRWESEDGALAWELHSGDFRETSVGLPAPELVFWDFYSPKTAPHLWDEAIFRLLYASCMPRIRKEQATALYTYSASTRVRVAMLLAGFFVGYGRNTGAKTDTTVAATVLSELERPLDARWIERLKRSHEPYPHGWKGGDLEELLARVLAHPQFSGLA